MGSVRERVFKVVYLQLPSIKMAGENVADQDAVKLVEGLGADSLDMIELVMALEEEFEVIIPDEKLDGVSTFADLVKLVEEIIAEDAKPPEQGIDPTQFGKDAPWEDQQLKDCQALMFQVLDENIRQISKWGVQKYDVFTWHAILAEEVGELAKAMLEYKFGSKSTTAEEIHKEAIQVATLAMKIAEMASLK